MLTAALIVVAILLGMLALLSLLEHLGRSLHEERTARELSAARARLTAPPSTGEPRAECAALLEETLAQDIFAEPRAGRARR